MNMMNETIIPAGSPWTPERVEKLKTMWAEGESASVIAMALNCGISRSAVIGKVHRLGLPGRVVAHKVAQHRPRGPRQPSAPKLLGTTEPKPKLPQRRAVEPESNPICPVDVPKGGRVNLLMLSEKTCRWPIGEPGTKDFFFCGMSPNASTPYCEHHARVAYQPLYARMAS